MASFCDKCGHELKNENARFCDKCGAEVKTRNSQAGNAQGVMTACPHCGQATPMGLDKCENCGSTLEDNTAAVIIGYIITLLLPLLGLIPAIYLLTRKNGKARTQGVFLIGIIILMIILNLIFSVWIGYVVVIIAMVVAAFLWFEDYTLFPN